MRKSFLISILLLCSCSDAEKARRHAEEASCSSRAISEYKSVIEKSKNLYKIARKNKESTVDILIGRRRIVEDYCLKSAICYGSKGESLSNFFEWCLDDEAD